jgi:hypothetical protein
MEHLPFELVRYIFSFLTISDRFRLRRVSRNYKIVTEFHMKDVKRVASYRRKVYSPFHAGCKFTEQEIWAAASRPQPLLLILKYCPSIQCLFIGLPALSSNPSLAEVYERPAFEGPRLHRHDEGEKLFQASHNGLDIWEDSDYAVVLSALEQMSHLKCVSWIGLKLKIPSSLSQKLEYVFCPVLQYYGCTLPPRGSFLFIEQVVRQSNLQDKDFSDLVFVGDRCLFIERHFIHRNENENDDRLEHTLCLRCPAGEKPFKLMRTPHLHSIGNELKLGYSFFDVTPVASPPVFFKFPVHFPSRHQLPTFFPRRAYLGIIWFESDEIQYHAETFRLYTFDF